MGETLGYAILDSGCTSTVCGNVWYETYIESLSHNDKKKVTESPSSKTFRFGDGDTYPSTKSCVFPIYTGSQCSFLCCEVVNCDVPLLLSKDSLKRAQATLDFHKDKIHFLGENVPLFISQSGHYCIKLDHRSTHRHEDMKKVLVAQASILNDAPDLSSKISKLHRQFAHPHPDRLKKLLRDSGISNSAVFDCIQTVSDNCDICKRFKKTPSRPIVGFPTASTFNEVVAMDLKLVINGTTILHMIDHAIRYSSACIVNNKKKETIVKSIMGNWVKVFGSPQYFLNDNGGEFVNSEMIEFSEQFNIILKTTAAESAWSNGLCERHNEILADLVRKILSDTGCSIEMALCWALSAKNALSNVYGFSPNQLVFGRNCDLPSTHTSRLPALSSPATSDFLRNTLNALHAARQAFVKQEASEKLRRALSRQTRSYSDQVFGNGESVYYWRNNSKEWHGPAKVLGRDGQQYLLKHGGVYIRVHPCRLQSCCNDQNISDLPPTNANPSNANASNEETETLDSKEMNNCVEDNTNSDSEDEISLNHTNSSHPNSADEFSPIHKDISDSEIDHGTFCEETDISVNSDNISTTDEIHDYIGNSTPSSSERDERDLSDNGHSINASIEETNQIKQPEITHSAETSRDLPQTVQPQKNTILKRLQNYNKPGKTEDIFFGIDTNSERFHTAKEEEIQKWRGMDTFEEVEDYGQPTLSCRWVCTEKMKDGVLVFKARLVVRGFEEDSLQLKKDSPTCNKESVRLLLLSSNNWSLHTLDIKSAFLQGNSIRRELYLKPPKFVNTNKLWKLKKTPYGLSDAGRQWYNRVKKELLQLGATQSNLDKATFIWYNNSTSIGVMIVHVDDFLYGGSKTFHSSIIPKIRTIFLVGSEESNSLRYLGLNITENDEGIELSTKGYGLSCEEITTKSLGTDRDRKLSPSEITSLKKLSGQLNWVTTQSRPDLAFDNCMIANSVSGATVNDILNANRALRRLRDQEFSLFFPRLKISTCHVVTFPDAGFANLPDEGSQGAFISFLIDKDGAYCPLAWQSKRIRRVVNNTLAAETLTVVEAAEASVFIAKCFAILVASDSPGFPISIMSDNKSLVDNLHTTTSIENKRLRIDVGVLRDMLDRKEILQVKWIPTKFQVANALTKKGCSSTYLCKVLQGRLKFDFSSGEFREM